MKDLKEVFCTMCGRLGKWKVEYHFGASKAFCSDKCRKVFNSVEYKA